MHHPHYVDELPRSVLVVDEVRYFKLGDARYMALPLSEVRKPRSKVAQLLTCSLQHLQIPREGTSLVTILPADPDQSCDQHWVQQNVDHCLKTDDVFRLEFLGGVIFTTVEGQSIDISQIMDTMSQVWGTSWSIALSKDSLEPECSGPHFLDHGKLYKAYRLHDDVNGAFMMGTKPKETPG